MCVRIQLVLSQKLLPKTRGLSLQTLFLVILFVGPLTVIYNIIVSYKQYTHIVLTL